MLALTALEKDGHPKQIIVYVDSSDVVENIAPFFQSSHYLLQFDVGFTLLFTFKKI